MVIGKVISDRTESLMAMLEAKKENMLRILKRDGSDGWQHSNTPQEADYVKASSFC